MGGKADGRGAGQGLVDRGGIGNINFSIFIIKHNKPAPFIENPPRNLPVIMPYGKYFEKTKKFGALIIITQ
jgi:hypothetical protein